MQKQYLRTTCLIDKSFEFCVLCSVGFQNDFFAINNQASSLAHIKDLTFSYSLGYMVGVS